MKKLVVLLDYLGIFASSHYAPSVSTWPRNQLHKTFAIECF